MATKLFDMHIEIGTNVQGHIYAKTMLGNNALKFVETGKTVMEAVDNLTANMEICGAFEMLMQNPTLSVYPLGSVAPPATQASTAQGTGNSKNAPARKTPSELAGVGRPTCEAQCTSMEHFGAGKCKTYCPNK